MAKRERGPGTIHHPEREGNRWTICYANVGAAKRSGVPRMKKALRKAGAVGKIRLATRNVDEKGWIFGPGAVCRVFIARKGK